MYNLYRKNYLGISRPTTLLASKCSFLDSDGVIVPTSNDASMRRPQQVLIQRCLLNAEKVLYSIIAAIIIVPETPACVSILLSIPIKY